MRGAAAVLRSGRSAGHCWATPHLQLMPVPSSCGLAAKASRLCRQHQRGGASTRSSEELQGLRRQAPARQPRLAVGQLHCKQGCCCPPPWASLRARQPCLQPLSPWPPAQVWATAGGCSWLRAQQRPLGEATPSHPLRKQPHPHRHKVWPARQSHKDPVWLLPPPSVGPP